MGNKTFLIVNAVPHADNLPGFQSYIQQIVQVFIKHGGSNTQRWKTVEQIIGSADNKVVAIFDFPSTQSIRDMITSIEFITLNDLRKKSFSKKVDLMICEML